MAQQAIANASVERADLICFPECFVPGYRGLGHIVAAPDPLFLDRAWSEIARAAAKADIAVVLGTETSLVSRTKSSSIPPRTIRTRRAPKDVYSEPAR